MLLELIRTPSTEKSTQGKLYIDGKYQCETLEDVERDTKVYGQTAIPKGEYQVILTLSPKYKRVMPLVVGVNGFQGIRIHSGNTAEDSEGCILVGRKSSLDYVSESRLAYADLFAILEEAYENNEEITLKIS